MDISDPDTSVNVFKALLWPVLLDFFILFTSPSNRLRHDKSSRNHHCYPNDFTPLLCLCSGGVMCSRIWMGASTAWEKVVLFFWFGYYRRTILWTNHHALWQQLLGESVLMAVSLVAVNFLHRLTQCSDFTLAPLETGNVYLGPDPLSANSCRCNTVYYSLLSACAYCQNGIYLEWIYLSSTECSF